MFFLKRIHWLVSLFIAGSMGTAWAQTDRSNLPWVDLSEQQDRQVVVASGTPELYHGHPTTVQLADGRIICTWSRGHGGKADFIAESSDGGKSWVTREAPDTWQGMSNCPSIYQLTDQGGKSRLFVFCQTPKMGQSYSEDGGKSWSDVRSLEKPCVMAFSSIVQLKNGDYLGMYHRGYQDEDRAPLTLWQSISHDGGLTWEPSVLTGEKEGYSPCEPCVFRSPDGKRLICVARENNRRGHSLMMFSDDEGESWSSLEPTPWGLTGDRHVIKYLPDGRLIAVFRDMAPNSPTKGHFVAWIGNYKDLREGTSGQYRIKLLHSFAGSDCGYPGVEILPDGTVLAVTYIKYHPGKERHSIVAVRFKPEETDALLGK